jgi:transcriptional regulator with XRE-family HTH domain
MERGDSEDGGSARAVGERIGAARRSRHMTQAHLAQAIGVTRSAVAQWETGRAGQVSALLPRIAAALGVSVGWLMAENAVDASAPADDLGGRGDELALLRVYRACSPEDRALLLRTARRLAGS